MSACDVGAGSGAFALALKNTGFFSQVVALDLSQKCVDACRGVGLEARLGSVGDLEPESVGLLTMNDVIEHVFSPVAFLKQARNVLRSGGLIAIATPNGEGFDFKILGKKTVNITPPEHLQYFNPVSMKILLERTGFEVLVNETPGVLDIQIVVREINNRNLKLSINNNWLNYLLLETDDITVTNFQRFLSENSLSSHLFVIARKQSL
jgi:SAM-dependent methyltransferase